MKAGIYGCSILILAAAAGCIPSERVESGQMDRYWTLTQDPTLGAPYHRPTFGETQLPAKWTIRQKKSLILSTISIVRAMDAIPEGPEEIEFSVSPAYTDALVTILGEARTALGGLVKLADGAGSGDRPEWVNTLAYTLAKIEYVSRLVSTEMAENDPDADEPLGIAAEPLLEMLGLFLNEQSGGSLLGDVKPEEIDQVRTLLTQVSLKLGFALAAREVPGDLRDAVTGTMKGADDLNTLESSLRQMLSLRVEQAPPAAKGGKLGRTLRTVLRGTEKALQVIESLMTQWNKMESIELAFHSCDGKTVPALTIRVRPGEEVRIEGLVIAQPVIAFRGTCKIVVFSKADTTGESVVTFEPVGDGAVDIQFKGFIYTMVRSLALPLASGRLREIRTLIKTRKQGKQMIHVTILMETTDRTDPRRMLVYQDARVKTIRREPFAIHTIEEKAEQVFNYITPRRRYTYQRTAGPRIK